MVLEGIHDAFQGLAELEDEGELQLLGMRAYVGWKGHLPGKLQLVQDAPWFFDQLNFEFAAPQIADSRFEH